MQKEVAEEEDEAHTVDRSIQKEFVPKLWALICFDPICCPHFTFLLIFGTTTCNQLLAFLPPFQPSPTPIIASIKNNGYVILEI